MVAGLETGCNTMVNQRNPVADFSSRRGLTWMHRMNRIIQIQIQILILSIHVNSEQTTALKSGCDELTKQNRHGKRPGTRRHKTGSV